MCTASNELPSYLEKLPYGLYEDTRFKYKPGTRVSITVGLYRGQEAMIDSLVGVTQGDDGNWDGEPGYNVLLQDGGCITVQWNRVIGIP